MGTRSGPTKRNVEPDLIPSCLQKISTVGVPSLFEQHF